MPNRYSRPPKCNECDIHGQCLFHALAKNGVEPLTRIGAKVTELGTNEYLFRSGEGSDQLHIVRSGCVKTYTISPDGHEVVLGFYLPGEIIGLEALSSLTHQRFAVTLEPTQTCVFSTHDFKRMMQGDPNLNDAILGCLSKELDRAQNQLLIVGHLEARQRVAFFIVSLSHRLGSGLGSKDPFKLPMDRRDIANHLGLTVETVSRVLSQFQRDKLINVDGKKIQINHRRALELLARPGGQLSTHSAASSFQPAG